MAKQLHFNKDGSALKKMQAGVDKLASVVGITLGPKVRLCPCTVEHLTYCHSSSCLRLQLGLMVLFCVLKCIRTDLPGLHAVGTQCCAGKQIWQPSNCQ